MNTFHCRAECSPADVNEAVRVLEGTNSTCVLDENEVVIITTPLSFIGLRNLLETGSDLHEMAETLQIPDRYTGIRVSYDKGLEDKGQVVPTRAEADKLYAQLVLILREAKSKMEEIDSKLSDFTTTITRFGGLEAELEVYEIIGWLNWRASE